MYFSYVSDNQCIEPDFFPLQLLVSPAEKEIANDIGDKELDAEEDKELAVKGRKILLPLV